MHIFPAIKFLYKDDSTFNGILHNSYFKTSDIFSLQSEISLSASSYDKGNITCILGVDNDQFDSFFQTKSFNNSWIQFELKGIRISVSDFLYRTVEYDFHTTWELQGSNDNKTFDILYQGKKESWSQKNEKETIHFTTNMNQNNQYSIIRVQSTGNRNTIYPEIYKLAIYGFEIFGSVYSIVQNSFFHKNSIFSSIYCIICLLNK